MRRATSAIAALALAAVLPLAGRSQAGEYGQHHYFLTDGLKAASLTTPGFGANLRTTYYYADDWYDHNGDRSYFKREIFFVEPELTWSSCAPVLLGARYEAKVAFPMASHVEDMLHKNDNSSREHFTGKIGDLRVTPITLGWELDRVDLSLGYTVFVPTGDFNRYRQKPDSARMPNPGKGYWTHMINFGTTVYLDSARTWHLSLLAHYEIHTRQDHTRIRWGDNLHFEGGVGKDFCGGWRAGLITYGTVQTRDNEWRNLDWGSGNRVFALGAEAGYFAREGKLPWFVTVRGAQEFAARGNFKGFRSLLTAGLSF